jgi:hypothetical protein
MAQRRVNEVAFNFDSLTDMVTNLAGGLILIVLLLTVLTRQQASQAGVGAMKTASGGAGESARSLELNRLRTNAAIVEQSLPKLEAEIQKAREEVARLQREVDATQPRAAADPEGKQGTPSRVDLRPPMLKKADKRTALSFVLSGKKIYCCIWADYLSVFNQERESIRTTRLDSSQMSSYMEGVLKSIKSGDFDMQIRVLEIIGSEIRFQAKGVMKPGAKGETLAEALAPGSDFNRLVGGFDGNTYYVDFEVYPDSFDLFIALRQRVVEKRFSYSWSPKAAGQDLIWMPGQGVNF